MKLLRGGGGMLDRMETKALSEVKELFLCKSVPKSVTIGCQAL